MTFTVKFCGASSTVTGSCYWVKLENCQFLVDCGLFQGNKTLKELNYGPFPFEPEEIDFVLITHAHTDHTALLPKLVKAGFKGIVYSTPATFDLVCYMLPDSGFIQEIEVSRLNRRNQQRGKKQVKPIYTAKDAETSLTLFRKVEYDEWKELAKGVKARFWNAGHILGSASIEIEIAFRGVTKRLLFSGDLGPPNKIFHEDPDSPQGIDYLFCESTYGGRSRQDVSNRQRRKILGQEIREAIGRGGNLLIPSFSVERTQELLTDIAYLIRQEGIPATSVFLDSPLAIKITSVFSKYADQLEDMGSGLDPFSHPRFHFTQTVEESKAINRFRSGAIIMAASGMCDAGRIRHHLKEHLWRPQSTILLVGFQAEGTLGSMLESGKKTVKIQGEEIKVRARVRSLDIYSGHADNDNLVEWVMKRCPVKEAIFLTHGARTSLESLADNLAIAGIPQGKILIPQLDDLYDFSVAGLPELIDDGKCRMDLSVLDKPDWHNQFAQLTIDIRQYLESVSDKAEKKRLMQDIEDMLRKR